MRFWFGKKESEQPPSRPNVIRKSISSYVRPTPALPVDRKTSEPAGDSPLGRSGSLITETRKTPTTGEFVPRARRGTLTTSDLEEFQRRSEDSSTSRRTSSASGPTRRRLSRAAEHRDDVTHPKIEALKAAQREAQERRAAQRKSFSPIEPPSELKDAQKLHRQNSSSKLRKYASHNLLRSRANSLTTSKSLENVNAAKAIRQVDVPEVPPMPERFAQGSARPIVPPERPVVKTAPEPTPEPTRTPSALRTSVVTGSSTDKSPGSSDKSPGSSEGSPGSSEKSPSTYDNSPGSSDKIPGSSDKSPGAVSSNSSPQSTHSFSSLDLQGVAPLSAMPIPSPVPIPESELKPRRITPPKGTLQLEIPLSLERHSSNKSKRSSARSTKSNKSNKSNTSEHSRGSRTTPFIMLTPASSIRSLARRLTGSPPSRLHKRASSKDSRLTMTTLTDAGELNRVSEDSMEFVCRGTSDEDVEQSFDCSDDSPIEHSLHKECEDRPGMCTPYHQRDVKPFDRLAPEDVTESPVLPGIYNRYSTDTTERSERDGSPREEYLLPGLHPQCSDQCSESVRKDCVERPLSVLKPARPASGIAPRLKELVPRLPLRGGESRGELSFRFTHEGSKLTQMRPYSDGPVEKSGREERVERPVVPPRRSQQDSDADILPGLLRQYAEDPKGPYLHEDIVPRPLSTQRSASPTNPTGAPLRKQQSQGSAKSVLLSKEYKLPENLKLPPIIVSATINPDEVFAEIMARV